jgi:hypothetical protein
MISLPEIKSKIRKIGPLRVPDSPVVPLYTLYELPPHKRHITIRKVNYDCGYYESDWYVVSENTYFLQLPYVFLMFRGSVETYLAFGKEPFGKFADLWFPSLPNVFDTPMCQVCTINIGSDNERLIQFWQTAFYDFANRSNRFSGTTIAEHFFGGFAKWAELDLNGLYTKMKWHTVEHGYFKEFQKNMDSCK